MYGCLFAFGISHRMTTMVAAIKHPLADSYLPQAFHILVSSRQGVLPVFPGHIASVTEIFICLFLGVVLAQLPPETRSTHCYSL
jgi:hypothetical protein